jgi:peptide deformylase
MVRQVLEYPHLMLRRLCEPPDEATAARVLQDLVDTMRAFPGCVGLAAPQIGEPVRVAVVDVRGHRLGEHNNGMLALVSPRIVAAAAGGVVGREGCLSLPHLTADVRRAERIVASTGETVVWSQGFEARAIQHEMDHLDGVLILDRVVGARGIHPRRTYLPQPDQER